VASGPSNSAAAAVSLGVGLKRFLGAVHFEVVPNFEVLIARNVISIGCDPEIAEAKAELENSFPNVEIPIDITSFVKDYQEVNSALNKYVEDLGKQVAPYDLDAAQKTQDDIISLLNGFAARSQAELKRIADTNIDLRSSTITVDKTIVRANNVDASIVSVTPRDAAGNAILKNVPAYAWPTVNIYTTLGTLSNQRINSATGAVDADLTSPVIGTAQLTAKINNGFIYDLVNGVQVPRQVEVKFVADSALPTRRRIPATVDKEPKKG
jgi:hypothetical protein